MEKRKFFDLLDRELVVALGCTEPVAIAYAAALAGKYVQDAPAIHIKVSASVNVIKNAMAVGIPGTGASGINLAAALGLLARDTDKNLELLAGLTREDIEKAKSMVVNGAVTVSIANTDKKLYIEVVAESEHSYAKVIIADTHTNVVWIEADGRIIQNNEVSCSHENEPETNHDFMSLDAIWEFTRQIPLAELDLIERSIALNKQIGWEGLNHPYGLQVGRTIYNNMEKGLLSNDAATYATALTAAGSDARMAGCSLPVMSNSGSGNQGISATLPVVAFAERLGVAADIMIRAVTLSHLITIHIKLKFGRLSAICGATISAVGAACGIAYLLGGGLTEIKFTIQNMMGNVTGMLCDGAKTGCALKIATCTSAAVQAALVALGGISIQATDGIIETDPEGTIDNLCRLGNQGTAAADQIILEILLKKENC